MIAPPGAIVNTNLAFFIQYLYGAGLSGKSLHGIRTSPTVLVRIKIPVDYSSDRWQTGGMISGAKHENRLAAIVALEQGLQHIETHAEHYRKPYDRAAHLLVALQNAGLRLVKARSTKKEQTKR